MLVSAALSIGKPNQLTECRMEVLYQVGYLKFTPRLSMLNNFRSYCVCVAFQVVFIYFMFPETAHLTLEELAFCKHICLSPQWFHVHFSEVYEDNKPGAEDSESEEKATSPTEEIAIIELV
jgi:hypothetical protein